MKKTTISITAFAVFATVLMLSTPVFARTIVERETMENNFDSAVSELEELLDAFESKLELDREFQYYISDDIISEVELERIESKYQDEIETIIDNILEVKEEQSSEGLVVAEAIDATGFINQGTDGICESGILTISSVSSSGTVEPNPNFPNPLEVLLAILAALLSGEITFLDIIYWLTQYW